MSDETALATQYTDLDDWEDKPQEAQYTKIKEIRFCGSLSKRALQEDIPIGNFFLFDPNVPQGEDPILTDLGKSIKANVIRDTKRLEVYEEFNGKDMFTITSSEFRDNDDLIFLYDRTLTDGNVELAALLPYINQLDENKCIKHLKNTRYGKRLRTKYIAYCLWTPEGGNPEVVKVGFTATDNTGCAAKEFKPRGFNDYAADSFLGLKSAANKIVSNKLFVQNVEIFSKSAHKVTVKGEEKDSTDCIKGFRIVDQIDDEQKVLVQEALKFVKAYLEARYSAISLKAYANTMEKEDIITLDERHIPLMIGNPSMLMGYEQIPSIDSVEIPKLDLPESDREKSSDPNAPIDAEIVDEKKAADAKAKPRPKTKDEVMSEKKAEREAVAESDDVKKTVAAAEQMHDEKKEEQAEKIKEVDEVFGT